MADKTLQEILENQIGHNIIFLLGCLEYIFPIVFIINVPIALISGICLLFYTGGTKLVYMSIISWFIVPYIIGFLTFPAKFFLDIKNKKISSFLIALVHWVVVCLWCYFAIAEEIIHGYLLSLGHIPTVALCTAMATLPIYRMTRDFLKQNNDKSGAISVIILAFAELASLLSIFIYFIFLNSGTIQNIRFVVLYVFSFIGIFEIYFHSKFLIAISYYEQVLSIITIINKTQQVNDTDSINKPVINEPVSEQPKPKIEIEVKPEEPEPEQPEIFIPDDDNEDDDITSKLINIGLAHIGRKTNRKNKYLTDEAIIERVSIENPFLDLLIYKFKDDNQRKIIKDKFMLFKETCLSMIYDVVLRNDKELHNRIKIDLQAILTEGLFSYGVKNRREYSTMFKKNFRDEFAKNRDINKALRQAFWSILAAKYPEWITLESVADILNNRCLLNIFNYSYMAIKSEYENYQQRQGT